MSTLPGTLHRRQDPTLRHSVSRPRLQRSVSIAVLRRLPRWWGELALALVIYAAYDITRGLSSGTLVAGDRHARAVLSAERALHLNVERSLNGYLRHAPVLAVLESYFSATLHFVVTPGVLI
jgi:hypothetical protein